MFYIKLKLFLYIPNCWECKNCMREWENKTKFLSADLLVKCLRPLWSCHCWSRAKMKNWEYSPGLLCVWEEASHSSHHWYFPVPVLAESRTQEPQEQVKCNNLVSDVGVSTTRWSASFRLRAYRGYLLDSWSSPTDMLLWFFFSSFC